MQDHDQQITDAIRAALGGDVPLPSSAQVDQSVHTLMTRAMTVDVKPSARVARGWPWITAIAMALIIAVSTSYHYGLWQPTIYRSASGEQRTVTLSDGTQVTLAPATTLEVPARFATGSRVVDLRGEAYFAVVHDAQHPFAVLTNDITITDVGTEFDVRAYPEDDETRVAVALGAVALVGAGRGNGATGCSGIFNRCGTVSRPRPSSPTLMLRAGDMAQVAGQDINITHGMDVTHLLAWRQGRLVFDGARLGDAVHDLARTFDLQITIADSALAAQRVTGTFDHLAVDEVLDEVTQVVGARFERRGRVVVIRRAPAVDLSPDSGHPALIKTVVLRNTQE